MAHAPRRIRGLDTLFSRQMVIRLDGERTRDGWQQDQSNQFKINIMTNGFSQKKDGASLNERLMYTCLCRETPG